MKASPRPSITYELIVNGHASPWLPVWRIGANSFDLDHLADRAAVDVLRLNSWCLDRGLDVRFVATRRHVEVFETSPGGFQRAKNDRGWVGAYLRNREADGWCSRSPAVIDALERRNNAEINSKRRKELRAARHTPQVREIDRTERAKSRISAFVKTRDAEIDAAVRAKPGWQDFATLWPKGMYMGLVIPIKDPHKSAD